MAAFISGVSHAHLGVAELKRLLVGRVDLGPALLSHPHLGVPELKPVGSRGVGNQKGRIPRPSGRGRIEASVCDAGAAAVLIVSHAHLGVADLKHPCPSRSACRDGRYPTPIWAWPN